MTGVFVYIQCDPFQGSYLRHYLPMTRSRVIVQEHQASMEKHVELASQSAFYSHFTGEADETFTPN